MSALAGVACLALVLLFMGFASGGLRVVHADPIEPPEGYPKLALSVKTVTPTLAETGGVTLYYAIEIRNTGAYTAENVTLTDHIDEHTSFTGEAGVSAPHTPTIVSETLTWSGTVGFDETVVVTFNVSVDETFSGTVVNTAVISQPLLHEVLTRTAETVVTDHPILEIEKTSSPSRPGHNAPLVYTLLVANRGQSRASLPITVTDYVPSGTTLYKVGMDGITGTVGSDTVITWTENVTLALNDTSAFTFSVMVDESVAPGDVLTNAVYAVDSDETDVVYGESYTVTVYAPEFRLSKRVWPDPPGSNREMTYTLRLLNRGALALDMVITDVVPSGVTYVRGGSYDSGVVSWTLDRLDTGQSAQFTYTVSISDVLGIPIVNDDYGVCDDAGVCQPGRPLTSVVQGPVFEATAIVDPIAKKPGGGVGTDVWPTLIVRNLGPGNALDAQATLIFERISVQLGDLSVDPSVGALSEGPDCGDKCQAYVWIGDLGVGDVVTFATPDGQNTIGGEEGTLYKATVIITDALGARHTDPVSDTAVGLVTHYANLNLRKTAPSVIGRGQIITYTIDVWNSALATDQPPPYPYLLDFLPEHVTLITSSISHGGTYTTISGTLGSMTVISWTLPSFGTGERLLEPRTFAVRVDADLVSGTQIVNQWYSTHWYESEAGEYFSNAGDPITTTVKEVGLIDSYKEVEPELLEPGPGNVLTYTLHIVNSSALTATDVLVYDELPWEASTYQRDAVASSGTIVSDIVSIRWEGDVGPFSSELVTFTVLVDEDYQGPITNTATISNADLLSEVVIQAVAWVTDEPVLSIDKSAPASVNQGQNIPYAIHVANAGQQATHVVVTDTIPANTTIITSSITAGGKHLAGLGQVEWTFDALDPGESENLAFAVSVDSGNEVVNAFYGIRADEVETVMGDPVTTEIVGGGHDIYLPLVLRNS
ncbi:MAG TPA: DUF11 domain-containing protein [Chloroflexi bacterium]|nr:DUF11 domain-containing protein [Chloroflexota bacterium]